MALQSASSPRDDQGHDLDDNSTTDGANTPSSSVSSKSVGDNTVPNLPWNPPSIKLAGHIALESHNTAVIDRLQRQLEVDDDSTINTAVIPPASSWCPEIGTRSGSQTPTSSLHKARSPRDDLPKTTFVQTIRKYWAIIGKFLETCWWWYGCVARVLIFGWLCCLTNSFWLAIACSHDSPPFPVNQIESSVVSHSSSNIKSSIPLPNHTYRIRSSSNHKLLAVRDGEVTLAFPGSPGSTRWECVQYKGWLGFRQAGYPRMFLGYDWKRNLVVSAVSQQNWENFVVSPTLTGGYVLMMTHHERLWHVGMQGGRLAKVGDGADGGIVWEFIQV